MGTNVKVIIERGKRAFEAYINQGEEALEPLALEYGIKLKTIKTEITKYANRLVSPKPTEEQLEKYHDIVTTKKKQSALEYHRLKEEAKKNRDNSYIDSKVLKSQEAFYAFLKTSTNPSAVVDLAFKYNTDPESIRTAAFKYAKRTEYPFPTEGELITFKAVNEYRLESNKKERMDFTYVEQLLKLQSDLVSDYLDFIIEGELGITAALYKIDLYLKYNIDKPEDLKKLNLIQSHLVDNTDYIREERKVRKSNIINNKSRNINVEKIAQILEEFLIDGSVSIKALLNKYSLSENLFNKNLNFLSEGSLKEQILYQEYQEYIKNEKEKNAKIIKLMNHYFKNGIEKNGEMAKFNLLDYYRLNNERPDTFISKSWTAFREGLFTRLELTKVINFFEFSTNNSALCKEEELIKYEFSLNGATITDEVVKMQLVKYLKGLGLPLHLNLYYCAYEEYLRGLLPLNNLTLE